MPIIRNQIDKKNFQSGLELDSLCSSIDKFLALAPALLPNKDYRAYFYFL
jgi:hypothetical protein